jgi:hypothetical protein
MIRTATLTLIVMLVASCADRNMADTFRAVVPVSGSETATVPAEDMVAAMSRTGFTREEILAHGPAIHNALAVKGAAEVRREGSVTAIFSVMDGSLYVVSRRGGTYVHRLGA